MKNIWLVLGVFASLQAQGSSFYVDPVHGNMANAGSQASPWSTLQAVFSAGKTFVAGDKILLLSGNHGDVVVKGRIAVGSVSISPAPSAVPVLASLATSGASYWSISGLAVTGGTPAILVTLSADSDHINFSSNTIYSSNDAKTWTTALWKAKARGGMMISGSGNTVSGNHIYTVATGIHIDFHATGNSIDHNLIENIGHDGIDETGAVNTLAYNHIVNFFTYDGNHQDGIQLYGSGNMHDDVINGNVIISYLNHPNPSLYTGQMQGIGMYSTYVNETVTNNVILNDHRIGIFLLGGKNCKVENNTVFPLNIKHAPSGGYSAIALYFTQANGTQSRPGVGNIVKNNIAAEFLLTNPDGSSVCASGGICGNNLVNTNKALFKNVAGGDAHLVNNSSTVGKADGAYAPALDADLVHRGPRYDLGAYQYGP